MKKLNSILLVLVLAFSTSCTTLNKAPKTYTQQVLELSTDPTKFNAIVGVGGQGGYCTGTVVSPKAVLTAYHCVDSLINDYKILSFKNAKNELLVIPAKVIMANEEQDIAILAGDFSKFNSILIDANPEHDLVVNVDVNAVNCGFAYAGSFVCYKMNDIRKFSNKVSAMGQVYEGMSGGPVIDLNTGYILGINHAYDMGPSGKIVVVPLTNLRARLQKVDL